MTSNLPFGPLLELPHKRRKIVLEPSVVGAIFRRTIVSTASLAGSLRQRKPFLEHRSRP